MLCQVSLILFDDYATLCIFAAFMPLLPYAFVYAITTTLSMMPFITMPMPFRADAAAAFDYELTLIIFLTPMMLAAAFAIDATLIR